MHPPRAIVVPGSVYSEDCIGRAVEGCRLQRASGDDYLVLVGTQREVAIMEEVALKESVPGDRIISNSESKTTIDNAYFARRLCMQLGENKVSIVTSTFQARRTWFTFKTVFGNTFDVTLFQTNDRVELRMLDRERSIWRLAFIIRLFGSNHIEGFKTLQDAWIRILERFRLGDYFLAYRWNVGSATQSASASHTLQLAEQMSD
ncbi:MAG: YdcF family protein [Nitrososphaerales archaeon]